MPERAKSQGEVIDLSVRFASVDDETFYAALVESVDAPEVNGVRFPRFPDPVLQSNFVGSAGRQALAEARVFWDLLKSVCARNGRALGRDTRVLDFGCGWGRYLRFLNKDVAASNLYGVDVNPEIVALCRSLGVPGHLQHIEPLGALPFEDRSLDVIMAYSVFTHLPEHVHLHWAKELTRVAAPGAVFVCTVEPRRFLEFIRDEAPRQQSIWHQTLARFAPQADRFLADFDRGEFVYLPTGGGAFLPPETYGEAVVPPEWIRRRWGDWQLQEYVDRPERFWQAVAALART